MEKRKHSVPNNIWFVYRDVFKDAPGYIVAFIIEAFLYVLLPLGASLLNAFVIGQLSQQLNLWTILLSVISAFIVYGIINAVYSYYETVDGMRYIDMRMCYHMQKQIEKIVALSPQQAESDRVRHMMQQATIALSSNWSGVEGTMRYTAMFVTNMLGLIVYAIIVGGLNIGLLLLLLGIAIINMLLFHLTTRKYIKIKDEVAECERTYQYINRVVDDVSGGKDIRIFKLTNWLIGKYDQAIRRQRHLEASYHRALFGADVAEVVLTAGRDLACYLYLIALLKQGLTVTDFVFYLGLIGGFAGWFTKISKAISELRQRSILVDDYRVFLDLEDDFSIDGEVPENHFESIDIVFDHVSFRYEGAKTDTLHDVSFSMKAGSHMALVGLNGAGKSTIVKLISGLYLPTAGHVYVNGIDTRVLNRRTYMQHEAAVFQDPMIISYTIAENIAFSETPDEARIWDAIEAAGLKDKVSSLKDGIHTYLGKDVSENGIYLSGGETQKLLLARALYRHPKFILLDEPTAALDALAESEIYEMYSTILEGKTALFISHRLASTRFCDDIILLENGQIKEQGTHDELMACGGTYAALFEVQSKYYKEEVDDHE